VAKQPVQTTLASSQSFAVGAKNLPAQPWVNTAGFTSMVGTVACGPMGDPASAFDGAIVVDYQDGRGPLRVGGITGYGGLVSTTKGGTPDTPMTYASDVTIPLTPNCTVQFQVVVSGPVAVTGSAGIVAT
jgi:hypothetical protein